MQLSQQTSQQQQRRLLRLSSWRLHDHSKRVCLFTSAEEVLPCVCSTRRRSNVTSESLFLQAFQSHSSIPTTASPEDPHSALFSTSASHSPHAASVPTERPFFFAVDCWPETGQDQGLGQEQGRGGEDEPLCGVRRICRIPKAFHTSYGAIVDPVAMTEMLSVLEPLAHVVHIVLMGLGPEIIQQHHTTRLLSRCSSKGQGQQRQGGEDEELETLVELEEAQLGAMAMALMKHGFPHVSILEGGHSAVLRFLRNCDGCGSGSPSSSASAAAVSQRGAGAGAGAGAGGVSLGMHVLVDVDQDAVAQLFSPSLSPLGDGNSNGKGAGTAVGVADLLATYGSLSMTVFRKRQPQSQSQLQTQSGA
jgi:hypothetical protein